MKQEDKGKSALPIYAFGIVFFASSLLIGLDSKFQFLACVAISVAAYWLLKSKRLNKKVQSPKKTGDRGLDELLKQGHGYRVQIRKLNDQIPDTVISAKLEQIELLSDRILSEVARKPEKRDQIRQFLQYYLPTTVKLLREYARLKNQQTAGESIAAALGQIESTLDRVIVAFRKLQSSLLDRDVVDLTAEMDVMRRMMESQGLTEKKDF